MQERFGSVTEGIKISKLKNDSATCDHAFVLHVTTPPSRTSIGKWMDLFEKNDSMIERNEWIGEAKLIRVCAPCIGSNRQMKSN